MHYILFYDVVDDYLERRAPLRAEHLELAKEARERGELVMAGAYDPPTGAALVFRVDDPARVEAFAKADPYVRNGIVKKWTVTKWTVVMGGDTA